MHKDMYDTIFTEYPDLLTIEQMCAMLGGISTKTGYRLLHTEKIYGVRVGRRYMIPKINVLAYLGLSVLEEI